MNIKNKYESDIMIKKLNLNRMLEGIFYKNNIQELYNFLNENRYPYYNLRDKSNSSGKFLYQITAKEVIEKSKNYQAFSIYESLAEADKYLILQGDIQLNEKFELQASLSDIKGISNRQAMQKPKYNIQVDLKENREPSIRGLNKIIDYICIHNLFNVIVEFSLFDIPVGIHHEPIIIWELRNY